MYNHLKHTTKHGSVLDYAIVGKNVEIKEQFDTNSPSDHRAISWELEIKNVRKRKVIKVPCKATADSISGQLLNDDAVIDATSFIQKLEKLKQRNKRKL